MEYGRSDTVHSVHDTHQSVDRAHDPKDLEQPEAQVVDGSPNCHRGLREFYGPHYARGGMHTVRRTVELHDPAQVLATRGDDEPELASRG